MSGWHFFSGMIDKERRANGLGRYCNEDGSVYVGQYKSGKKVSGTKYELRED